MARLARLRVYPVKGLDGVGVETAAVREDGTLAHNREYALFDSDDEVVNGKRTPRVHDLSTAFDPSTGVFRIETPAGERRSFDLPADRERAAAFFGDVFGLDLRLARDGTTGFPNRPSAGPSVETG